jgi:hypothetical protein
MRTIGGGFVASGVGDGRGAGAEGAARRVLWQGRERGALGGAVLRLRNLQDGRPGRRIRDAAPGRLVGVGVLQSADVRRRAAVRVGHQLAPALEVAAAQKVVDRGLDHHEENAEVEGVNHQAAVLPPVPFLHSQPNNQLRLESLAISPHLSIKANLQHH